MQHAMEPDVEGGDESPQITWQQYKMTWDAALKMEVKFLDLNKSRFDNMTARDQLLNHFQLQVLHLNTQINRHIYYLLKQPLVSAAHRTLMRQLQEALSSVPYLKTELQQLIRTRDPLNVTETLALLPMSDLLNDLQLSAACALDHFLD